MFNDGHEQQAKCPSQGLLRPGRFLWARAVPWGIVLGIVLWIAYKFVKGVGIDWGLDALLGRYGRATRNRCIRDDRTDGRSPLAGADGLA